MIEEAYKRCTIRRKTKDGYMIKCRKGLWRVDASDKSKASIEARGYFYQYYMDGEYNNKETK